MKPLEFVAVSLFLLSTASQIQSVNYGENGELLIEESTGGEKFDFGIFENFVSNGQIFKMELQSLKRLRKIHKASFL